MFAVLGLAGGIPAGAAISGFGDRRMLVLGLGAIAAGSGLGALTSHYGVLVTSRIVEGLGFLLVTVAGPAILNRISPAGQRDLAFALWSCFMPAGIALAMLAGPCFSDWRAIWWTGAIIASLAIAAALVTVPGSPRRSPTPPQRLARNVLAVLTAGGPPLLALCFALYSLMFFALFSFLPVLLMQRMGLGYGTAGMVSALASASNILGNLAAGFLLSRGARRGVLIASASLVMGITAPCVFLQIFPNGPLLLLCIMFSAVGGLIPATLLSSAPVLAPAAALAPMVVGLTMQGSSLGQVAGPVAVGALIDTYGWGSAGLLVIVAAITAIIVALLLDRTTPRS
ncbi:CynX/NimT family MFS transporter [Labrys portucalensis]|uniref:CynX/NimT family MFS transporter n=1 Tax=Labrys neptuniae TaxID=376174 RepID=A0ABV6ZKJ1_9HYPH